MIYRVSYTLMGTENSYFNQKQAAEALGVKRLTVYRWIKSGKIATVEVGGFQVISAAEVERKKAQRGSAGSLV